MKRFIGNLTFLIFLLFVSLNISCEKPTGDFVLNQAKYWSDILVVPITANSDRSKIKIIKK